MAETFDRHIPNQGLIVKGGSKKLLDLLSLQLKNLFFLEKDERKILKKMLPIVLKRCEHCFSGATDKYYFFNDYVVLSPYHSGQYCIFLYYFANTIFRSNEVECQALADKLYYLNKTLNGLDLFYEVRMPDIFFVNHPVGSVIGRAEYGDYFNFRQNCTVGNNKGVYPRICENVKMMSGSKVLGKSFIGSNTIISANAYVKDADIPECSIVFGQSPNLVIRKNFPAVDDFDTCSTL